MDERPSASTSSPSAGATALRLIAAVVGFVVAYVVMYYITSGGHLPFVGR